MEIFDIFLLETVLNGILFGGVLALLALGLNLIFGVIDVVWICYAERQQGQHAAKQNPVEHRFEQKNIEDFHYCFLRRFFRHFYRRLLRRLFRYYFRYFFRRLFRYNPTYAF